MIHGRLERDDVVGLTEFFKGLWSGLETGDSLDIEFAEHLTYCTNQTFQYLRKGGWSKETLEDCGKLLYRLYVVYSVYKRKRELYKLDEWVEKVILIGEDMEFLFNR